MFTSRRKEQPMPDYFGPLWELSPRPKMFHLVRVANDNFIELDVSELAKLMTAVDTMIDKFKGDPHGQALLDEYSDLLKKLQSV